MRKALVIFYLLLISFLSFSKKKEPHSSRYQFIVNQGQFHPNSLFRVDVPHGYLFLENNTFTYHFYDGGMLSELHHGEYQGDTTQLTMKLHAYKVKFENANPTPEVLTSQKTSNHFNFYLGNDKNKWASKVPAYEEVKYKSLYPGIDFRLYKNEYKGLKYDLIIAPNADPKQIKLSYSGVDSLYLKNGKLYVITSLNENWEEKPEAWQIIDGKKKKVACKYKLDGEILTYEFPNGYNSGYELLIDPIMVFSSYSGSLANNFGFTATYDKFGFLYSGSTAFNPGYPYTLGAYDTTYNGGAGGGGGSVGTDITITKWDTTGTTLIYSTYLGGSGDEAPHSLVVSEFSELYVMGTTGSLDYPTSSNALDTSFNIHSPPIPVNILGSGIQYLNGVDIIVTRFDSSGSQLRASTYLGGTNTDGINNGLNKRNYADEFRGEIDIDKKGNVYVVSCTRSDDNPISSNGFQTSKVLPATGHIDGILYKLNPDLSTLEWSNYIGGSSDDAAYSIAIDQNNDVYVTGGTRSTNFPVSIMGFDTSFNGGNDAFITKISEDGNTMISSSYYGTAAYDQSYFVELDFEDYPHIFGQTAGPQSALIQNAVYQDPLGGQLVTKFKPSLDSVMWSTRFGSGRGIPDISPTAFLVDLCSSIYLSGWGGSTGGTGLSTNGLDITPNAYQSTTDGSDFYIMVMSSDASGLVYGSFMGGSVSHEHVDGGTSRFDRKGKVYQAVCAGCGDNDDFPTYPNPGAWSNTNNTQFFQGCNLAVFKMDFLLPIVVADFNAPTSGCAPFTVNFQNLSLQQSQTTFLWNFGDGATSTQFEPNHTYSVPGTYTVKLFVSDAATCNLADSIEMEIRVLSNTNSTLPSVISCNGEGTQIGIPHNNDPYLTIQWVPSTGLSDTTILNPIAYPTINTIYSLIIGNGVCFDTISQLVEVDSISVEISGQTTVCSTDAPFLLTSTTFGNGMSYQWSNYPDMSDTISANPGGQSIWVTPIDSLSTYYLQVTSSKGCTGIDSFQMVIQDLQNPISASFIDPGVGCAPALMNFSNSSDSMLTTTYLWSFGDGNFSNQSNPSNVYTQDGTYTVTLVAFDSSICPQSDTFSMAIRIRADSNYSVTDMACLGQETEIGIPADTVTGTTYSWFPGTEVSDSTINNPTVTITTDATYLLVVQHVCTDSILNHVTVSPIYSEADSLLIICSDAPTVNQIGNSNGTGVAFIWSSNSNLSDTLNSSIIDSTFTTTQTNTYQYYYFNVRNADGCSETDSVYAVISDQTISISGDTFICQNDTIQLHAVNNFLPNPMDFYWNPSGEIIGSTDSTIITVAPNTNTTYYLTAVNDSGCTFTDSILVEVSLLNDIVVNATTDDDSVIVGFSTIIRAMPNTGYNYSWTPTTNVENPNQSSTSVAPTETTTYTVNISDPSNSTCSYSSDVTVHVYEINCGEPDIFIPNAFSPNQDGENDEYRISGKVVDGIELKIYNRWGELVFETDDVNKGWDGKFNGKDVDPVVFVYHLTVTCIDKNEFLKKGNITVIR